MLALIGHRYDGRKIAIAALALLLVLSCLVLLPATAWAQSFPQLTGRVVDGANVIPDDAEARLSQKLAALETQSHRQLIIVALADLQGYEISDYGYQLGRHWGIGDKERNDGALLIIAPNQRKVRIEVGYGLEPVLTDGLSALIIQGEIVPRFKAGDMPGGIEAGADAVIKQLTLPDEEARKIAAAAKPVTTKGSAILPAIIWLVFISLVFILPMARRARGGSQYRSSGLGPIILWSVLSGMSNSRGGGGGWSGGGGGGFSGGGGSFGGGGASGGW